MLLFPGVLNYLQPMPDPQNYIQRCRTDYLCLDEDLTKVADEISASYDLPRPEHITKFSTAADLFTILSELMQQIIN